MNQENLEKIARMMLQAALYLPGKVQFCSITSPRKGREEIHEELGRLIFAAFNKAGYCGDEKEFISLFADINTECVVEISCSDEVVKNLNSEYHTAPIYCNKRGVTVVFCNGVHQGRKHKRIVIPFFYSYKETGKNADVKKFALSGKKEQRGKKQDSYHEEPPKYPEGQSKNLEYLKIHRQQKSLIMFHETCYTYYCPICDDCFVGNDYLRSVFSDIPTLWLANMVTHHRHKHIKHWDRMWGKYSSHYRAAAHYHDEDYEERKSEVNERAKRVIVSRATDYLRENNVTIEAFMNLRGTTEQTLNVVRKCL
ncbi:MAG: hypothetical protein ACI3YZ_02865 [Prevotella sp.]